MTCDVPASVDILFEGPGSLFERLAESTQQMTKHYRCPIFLNPVLFSENMPAYIDLSSITEQTL